VTSRRSAAAAVRISYLSINCTEWTACRAFYEALGITFAEEEHPGVPLHLSGEIGGAVLELHGPGGRGGPVGPGFRLGFEVDDVHGAAEAVVAAGGVLQRAPAPGPWGLRAVVVDPDRRRVELTGPARQEHR
jgi:predicted enzyme related to lactoylglutathione lyase